MLKEDESMLYVAMTGGNCIWRVPLMAEGTVSKVGVFIQLSGGLAGPDGMERGPEDSIHVAHAGNGCCLLYTSPSPRDGLLSRMPSSA